MKKKIITVELADGLEARPAAMLVQVASQYDSRIYLESGSKRVNAKSIMGMMTLGLDAGEEITLSANGEDEEAAKELAKFDNVVFLFMSSKDIYKLEEKVIAIKKSI